MEATRDGTVLSRGADEVEIAHLGAEVRRWRVGGRDLLWGGDSTLWDGVAPVLFPVVGWTRGGVVRVDGSAYPLGLHGFARHRLFALEALHDDSVALVLRDDAGTHALYPFRFRLRVTYRLGEASLSSRIDVSNEGDRPMPYAAGLHPGFRWPLPGGEGAPHTVVFDEAERPYVPEIAPGGLFREAHRPVPLEGRTLSLGPDTFAREALCFLHARSRGLRFAAAEGGSPSLRVNLRNLPHIVLWSRPGAPFLCIEGWSGWGDPEDFTGNLFEKPGMTLLGPGETGSHAFEAAFDDASAAIGS